MRAQREAVPRSDFVKFQKAPARVARNTVIFSKSLELSLDCFAMMSPTTMRHSSHILFLSVVVLLLGSGTNAEGLRKSVVSDDVFSIFVGPLLRANSVKLRKNYLSCHMALRRSHITFLFF